MSELARHRKLESTGKYLGIEVDALATLRLVSRRTNSRLPIREVLVALKFQPTG